MEQKKYFKSDEYPIRDRIIENKIILSYKHTTVLENCVLNNCVIENAELYRCEINHSEVISSYLNNCRVDKGEIRKCTVINNNRWVNPPTYANELSGNIITISDIMSEIIIHRDFISIDQVPVSFDSFFQMTFHDYTETYKNLDITFQEIVRIKDIVKNVTKLFYPEWLLPKF